MEEIVRKDIINYRLADGKVIIGYTFDNGEKIIINEANNEWWNDYTLWLSKGNKPLPANPLPNPIIIKEDWDTLGKTLSESLLFYKVYTASKVSIEVNAIFTVLQTCITTTKNEVTLLNVLKDLVKLSVVSIEDKVFINKLLVDNKFSFIV